MNRQTRYLLFDRDDTLGEIDRERLHRTGETVLKNGNVGALNLLRQFRKEHFVLALATLGMRDAIVDSLRPVGLEDMFDILLGGEEMNCAGGKIRALEHYLGMEMTHAILVGNGEPDVQNDIEYSTPAVPVIVVQSAPSVGVHWNTTNVYHLIKQLYSADVPTAEVFDALHGYSGAERVQATALSCMTDPRYLHETRSVTLHAGNEASYLFSHRKLSDVGIRVMRNEKNMEIAPLVYDRRIIIPL